MYELKGIGDGIVNWDEKRKIGRNIAKISGKTMVKDKAEKKIKRSKDRWDSKDRRICKYQDWRSIKNKFKIWYRWLSVIRIAEKKINKKTNCIYRIS